MLYTSTLFKRSLSEIGKRIGNTPLHKLDFQNCNLYTKLEYHNPFGSIKDRPAFFILYKAFEEGLINKDTTVIESTSGNFGIALASICQSLNIKFIAVIDPVITKSKQDLLNLISYEVIKVTERDDTGGYLINRIKVVKSYINQHPNSYNPNQYENPNNYLSYYHSLGEEICQSFSKLDYAFICVSSGGTIIGISKRLKEGFPGIKIIAVDIEGSLIFSDAIKLRKIPGIGASIRSPLLDNAVIDDVIILSEADIISGSRELLQKHSLFLGASSGAAYKGAKLFLNKYNNKNRNAIFISPDHGSSYLESIYSDDWITKNIHLKRSIK